MMWFKVEEMKKQKEEEEQQNFANSCDKKDLTKTDLNKDIASQRNQT